MHVATLLHVFSTTAMKEIVFDYLSLFIISSFVFIFSGAATTVTSGATPGDSDSTRRSTGEEELSTLVKSLLLCRTMVLVFHFLVVQLGEYLAWELCLRIHLF